MSELSSIVKQGCISTARSLFLIFLSLFSPFLFFFPFPFVIRQAGKMGVDGRECGSEGSEGKGRKEGREKRIKTRTPYLQQQQSATQQDFHFIPQASEYD